MSDNAKDEFDSSQPLTTTRSFRAGRRQFKPNEVFDPKELGCPPGSVEDLYDTGYLRYGVPRPRVSREERAAKRESDAAARRAEHEATSEVIRARVEANRLRKEAEVAPTKPPPSIIEPLPAAASSAPESPAKPMTDEEHLAFANKVEAELDGPVDSTDDDDPES